MSILSEENRYKLLKLLQDNPAVNQRELAKALGVSLGKTNYCLNALIEKGLVKVNNFRRNTNKARYVYLLTPKGIEEKAKVTLRFLDLKQKEFQELAKEIEDLRQEVSKLKR